MRLVEFSNLKWFVPCCTDPDCSDHTHNRRRHNLSACLNNDDQSADVETHNCSYFDPRIMSHTQCCINIPVLFFEKCSLLQDASQEATNAPSGLLRRRQRCVELVHHDLLGQQPDERVLPGNQLCKQSLRFFPLNLASSAVCSLGTTTDEL